MLTFFIVSSLVFLALNLALFIFLHIRNPKYSLLSHAVSDYAIGETSRIFIFYIITSVVAYILLGIGLLQSQEIFRSVKTLILCFAVPVLRLGLMLFKTDLEGTKLTRKGFVHYLFAILSFAAVYMFINSSADELMANQQFQTLHNILSSYTNILTVILVLVCVTLMPKFRKYFGIFERIFLLMGLIWAGFMAIVMLSERFAG